MWDRQNCRSRNEHVLDQGEILKSSLNWFKIFKSFVHFFCSPLLGEQKRGRWMDWSNNSWVENCLNVPVEGYL